MESERERGGGREGERQRSVIFNYNCNHICNDLTDNNREANEKCNQCCGFGVGVSGVFLMRQIFVIITITYYYGYYVMRTIDRARVMY